MSSGLTDDDRERIESFCETPSHDRSPDDLLPERTYSDDVGPVRREGDESALAALWHRLRRR
jgi:hypothetical protein